MKEMSELNNPIFNSAMLQLTGKRFIVSGIESFQTTDPDGVERTHIRMTFTEAPDWFVFVPTDRAPEAEKESDQKK